MRDFFAAVGFFSLCGGAWAVYWPAAFIVAGVILLGVALVGEIRDGGGSKAGGDNGDS